MHACIPDQLAAKLVHTADVQWPDGAQAGCTLGAHLLDGGQGCARVQHNACLGAPLLDLRQAGHGQVGGWRSQLIPGIWGLHAQYASRGPHPWSGPGGPRVQQCLRCRADGHCTVSTHEPCSCTAAVVGHPMWQSLGCCCEAGQVAALRTAAGMHSCLMVAAHPQS